MHIYMFVYAYMYVYVLMLPMIGLWRIQFTCDIIAIIILKLTNDFEVISEISLYVCC